MAVTWGLCRLVGVNVGCGVVVTLEGPQYQASDLVLSSADYEGPNLEVVVEMLC